MLNIALANNGLLPFGFFFLKKKGIALSPPHILMCVCACVLVCVLVWGAVLVCVYVWSGEVAMNCSILYISAARTQTACLLKTGP